MKILIINHNGGSIYHGPNLRTYYAAKELVKRGHKVTIASSSYSHKYNVLPKTSGVLTNEIIDGIDYKWVRCVKYRNILKRIYSHFEFGMKIIIHRRNICSDANVVIFSGPPPEIFLFSLLVARFLKAPIISDIRDLWPRTQIEMSRWNWLNPYTYFLFFSQYVLVKKSVAVVSPLPGIENYLSKIGFKKKIAIIENGFDLDIIPSPKSIELLVLGCSHNISIEKGDVISASEVTDTNRFVIGYSGAFDRDNDVDSLMKAAQKLSHREDVLFLFIGDGIKRKELINSSENSPNILICNRVSPADVPHVLNAMDVCYCGLKPKNIYRYGVSLAKSFEYMAARKPMLWMVDACNNPVQESGGGVVVEAGNVSKLVEAIEQVVEMDKETLRNLGELGFRFLEENNSYRVLGDRWEELVLEVGNHS